MAGDAGQHRLVWAFPYKSYAPGHLFVLFSLTIRKINPITAKSQISFGGTYFIYSIFFLFRFFFYDCCLSLVCLSLYLHFFLSGCPPFSLWLHPTSNYFSLSTTTSSSPSPSLSLSLSFPPVGKSLSLS